MGEGAVITIDLSTAVVIVFAAINLIVLGPVAWIVNGLIRDHKELVADLAQFKSSVGKEFVRETQYRRDIQDLKDMLGRLFEKLDGKADK